MWRVTFKGLLAHRVRLVLTTISVVLGVAFVAGTFILTDTMTKVFDDLVRGGSQTIDVLVRSASSGDGEIGTDDSFYGVAPLDASLADQVAAVDGVSHVEGTVEGYSLIVRPDGEAIVPMGPPTLGGGWTDDGARFVREDGREPSAADEVVIDATTADRNELAVGDDVTMVFADAAPRPFTIVGITEATGGEDLAGATYAQFTMETAQEVLGLQGRYTGISVWGVDGVDPDELASRVDASLPDDAEAITAADWADETMAQIEDALGFITIALGAFAAIALVVGAFIIANTFSITVLQRSREFALLRALGASRRQVVSGVVGEAIVVGLLASVLGIVAGMGLAWGLQQLLSAFGLDMPYGSLVVLPRTIAIAFVVGTVVTVISSLLPARRAASMHPVAAMRGVATPATRISRRRTLVGIVVGALATLLITGAAVFQPDAASTLVGLGALLAIVALTAAGPALTRPVVWTFGRLARRNRTVGKLARGNTLRTPRRTWSTAAALTIGLALVSCVAVMAASMKASVAAALDQTLRADVIVSASNAFTGGGVPPILARELADTPGIGAVSPLRATPANVDGDGGYVLAIAPEHWHAVHATEVTAGSFEDLGASDGIAVDSELATAGGLATGDTVSLEFPNSGPVSVRVAAIYEPDDILSGWVVPISLSDRYVSQPMDAAVLVSGESGADASQVRTNVEAVTADYPAVTVQDQGEYRDSIAGQIDQLLAMVTALLAMALIIAVLGIMNTLALSIHERTREIGLLRAVGMTRRQVRAMVRWESVTVASLGALVGLVVGSYLGWAVTRTLAADGMSSFVVPTGQLVGAAVLAGLAGVLAAVLPARKAARLDVLRAVTVE